jgi:hypothetical protein
MTKDLDLRRFFMTAPHKWLRRYFDDRHVLNGINWKAVTVRKIEPIHSAFFALDENARTAMIDDFRNIAMLSTPLGKVQIMDEADYWGEADGLGKIFEELEDPGACAFWTFFERPKWWNGAVFLASADSKPRRPWRTRINMPVLGRKPTHEDGRRLAASISEIFMPSEARGRFCEMHQLRRGDLEYYFAYPQDHRETSIEYDRDGQMTKRPHNPAFEIIFVHDDKNQTLAIWHIGPMERVRDLQVAFAKAVLGTIIPNRTPKDDRVYDLSLFEQCDFEFSIPPILGIEKVEVHKLRIHVRGPNPHTVAVKLDRGCAAHVLYDRVTTLGAGIPKTLQRISQVGLFVTFEMKPGAERQRTKYFEITSPNSCSLATEGSDQLIRRLLIDNGIGPRRPKTDTDDGNPVP